MIAAMVIHWNQVAAVVAVVAALGGGGTWTWGLLAKQHCFEELRYEVHVGFAQSRTSFLREKADNLQDKIWDLEDRRGIECAECTPAERRKWLTWQKRMEETEREIERLESKLIKMQTQMEAEL